MINDIAKVIIPPSLVSDVINSLSGDNRVKLAMHVACGRQDESVSCVPKT